MKIFLILLLALNFLITAITVAQSTQVELYETIFFETITQNNLGSGWQSAEPGMLIIATPDELLKIRPWLHEDDHKLLETIDYDSYFVVAVFRGRSNIQDGSTSTIEVDKVTRDNDMIHISTSTHTLPREWKFYSVSPYYIISIEKDGSWGTTNKFLLSIDQKETLSQSHFIPSNTVAFETVVQSSDNHSQDGRNIWSSQETKSIVISSQNELPMLEAFVTSKVLQSLEAVDYEQKFVFAIFLGQQQSPGYRVEIQQIRHQQGKMQVDALTTTPQDSEQIVDQTTSPYHIVSVDKQLWWDSELDFVISLNGQPLFTTTHHIPNHDLDVHSIQKSEYRGTWKLLRQPGFILVDTPRDIPALDPFIYSYDDDFKAVDYSQYFVAALFQGLYMTTNYEIHLEQARIIEKDLWINSYVLEPFVGSLVGHSETSPHHIVKIPRDNIRKNQKIDINISMNGKQAMTQTHYLSAPSQMISLEKEDTFSGWNSFLPSLKIVDTENDIASMADLLTADGVAALQALDYTAQYGAVAFLGQRPSTGYAIEIQSIRRDSERLILESRVSKPSKMESVSEEATSPYHIVQIDRFYENGREIDFVLELDEQKVLTQTHKISDPHAHDFTTLEKLNGPSGWIESAPQLIIIANPHEINGVEGIVGVNTLDILSSVDYSRNYVVGVFQGVLPWGAGGINIYQITQRDKQIVVHASANWAYPPIPDSDISPYHLIQVDRSLANDSIVEFALVINSMEVLTRTYNIPAMQQVYLPFVTQ